jgi:TonB-linked SusC/RagA family outer membrane protein
MPLKLFIMPTHQFIILKHKALLMLFCLLTISFTVISQAGIEVKGKVYDELGEPLQGVNIRIKGHPQGTITGSSGLFSLVVPSDESILIFTYLGFYDKELQVKGNRNFNIRMKEVPQLLDEVVVVGYSSQKKANLTGSVQSVNAQQMQNRPITNISSALQGLASGVEVTQNSGQPGEDVGTIRIRGINSLDNNNNPLVIIDGAEGNIDDVNPNDIESISILKDAASASIYGNRASDGVIIIKTKSGEEGRVKLRYSNNFAWQQATSLPEIVDALSWINYYKEARDYAGLASTLFNPEGIENELVQGRFTETDWYKSFYKTAPMQNHYISVSGGSKSIKSSLSFDYLNQDGILFNTHYNKYSIRGNHDLLLLNDRLKIKLSYSGTTSIKDRNSRGENQMILDVNLSSPAEAFYEKGFYSYNARDMAIKEAGGKTQDTRNTIDGNISFNYYLIKKNKHLMWAQVNLQGMNYTTNFLDYVPSFRALSGLDGNSVSFEGYILKRHIETKIYTNENILFYEYRGKNLKLNTLSGYSTREWKNEFVQSERKKVLGNMPLLIMGDPSTQLNSDGGDKKNDRSLFGRVNLSYKDRFLLEMNGRYDGSSRFSYEKWGFFPSFSGGWRISQEDFYLESDINKYMNDFKIRSSYGILGNQNINTYYAGSNIISTNTLYSFDGSPVSGASLTTIANKKTTWEKTNQFNLGIDISLFNKLSFTVDYYVKNTKDLLWRVPLPLSVGLGSGNEGYQNIGKMQNKGIDVNFVYNTKFVNDLGVHINGTMSFVRNKIVDLGDLDLIFNDGINQILASKVGYAYASFYGYEHIDIFKESDFNWTDQNGGAQNDPTVPIKDRKYSLKEGIPSQIPAPRPGDLRFKDISGPDGVPDGVIDASNDKTIIGSHFPDFSYSMNLRFDFKGFDFGILFTGVQGRDMYEQGVLTVPFFGARGNVTKEVAKNRWTYENPNATGPRLHIEKEYQEIRNSYYIKDASYLRVKSIEFGYDLPKNLINRFLINKLRAYVSLQNAFTLTNYKGFDPEHSPFVINNNSYPVTTVYSFGMNLGF